MEGDYIEIIGLDVNTRIGVPEEERAVAQKISIDVNLKPSNGLKSLNDKIEQTIDYYLVSEVIKRNIRFRTEKVNRDVGRGYNQTVEKRF